LPIARSPDAERMRRYRARLKRQIAIVPVPITGAILGHLVRRGFLRDREVHARAEIGAAIAAALERLGLQVPDDDAASLHLDHAIESLANALLRSPFNRNLPKSMGPIPGGRRQRIRTAS
jgi:hypothetical protein